MWQWLVMGVDSKAPSGREASYRVSVPQTFIETFPSLLSGILLGRLFVLRLACLGSGLFKVLHRGFSRKTFLLKILSWLCF